MKTLLFISVIFLYSCSIAREVKPFPQLHEFKSFETIAYGDERFDDCKDLYNITWGITYDGDTLRVKYTPRYNCKTYNYKTYNYKTWTD